jgi:hypothetical protein
MKSGNIGCFRFNYLREEEGMGISPLLNVTCPAEFRRGNDK